MLSLWRRHERKCPSKSKGRGCTKCQCPVWCDGDHCGRRIRQSLGTRDWARVGRKLSDLEDKLNKEARGEGEPERKRKSVSNAVAIFLGQCEIEPASMKKYRRVLAFLFDVWRRSRHQRSWMTGTSIPWTITNSHGHSARFPGKRSSSCSERFSNSVWIAIGSIGTRPKR